MADPNTMLGDAIHELARELNMRQRVYPRWVADQRLSQAEAQVRIARLAHALRLLRELRAEARHP
jgi:hypothetical protein